MKIDPVRQQECVDQTIEWLHQAWVLVTEKHDFQPDPFYPRNALLTPAIVKDVLESIEKMFLDEFAKFQSYHRNAQGVSASQKLVPPRFLLLPYPQQVAIVQGIDKIFQEYRVEDSQPQPITDDDAYDIAYG